MRRLILIPMAMLCVAASTAFSQPGPEQQAPVESATPLPEPASVQPIPEEPAVITSPENDPLVRDASPEPVSLDSADASHGNRIDDALPSADSVATADSARIKREKAAADAAAHRAVRGRHDFQPPPVQPPAPVVTENDVPYEDERGEGRRLKSDPRASKLYRSPRKAFFYSLVVPGAGQAWCKAYVRAGLFVAAELGLVYGWYDISIRQARAKSREATRYADAHWSSSRYEGTRKRLYDEAGSDNSSVISQATPYRDRYCDAIYGYEENPVRSACIDVPDTSGNYRGHVDLLADSGMDAGSIGRLRSAKIKDLVTFYDRIGRDEEFVPGWEDATSSNITFTTLRDYDSALTDNDPSTVPSAAPWGTSQMRAQYLAMRRDADDLASTQSWFIGGLVLNHLLSAVDAALTAQRSNRRLYAEEKTSWVDGIHVQGGLAWANGPATRADMFLEF